MESSNTNRIPLSQSGFTLIEIMIAVAIISILAAISMVGYQTHIRKTQIMTIYQEINNFRTPYQMLMNEGAGVTAFSPTGLNVGEKSKHCQFSVIPPNADAVTPNAVTCQIQNLSYLSNEYISLNLTANGKWHCTASTGISKFYLPQDCQ
ncbi:pilin [Psychrobacter sp. APC 3279]|uniref:pilin n=1 Tax=Psychrobacter sp. APC 3279 TaxID=3035189 RepID=UPI0025B30653|nr:pilin [Psychrobacter sp. APC 3279]MDN3440362.1 pilin [Psychrobacter sp. APC 3279]